MKKVELTPEEEQLVLWGLLRHWERSRDFLARVPSRISECRHKAEQWEKWLKRAEESGKGVEALRERLGPSWEFASDQQRQWEEEVERVEAQMPVLEGLYERIAGEPLRPAPVVHTHVHLVCPDGMAEDASS